MKTSEKIDLISAALVKSQHEIGTAIKQTQGPRGKYADMLSVIDAIKEPLNTNKISFLQLVQSGEYDSVETVLLHESGQYIASTTKVYCNKPNDPQAFGSGITYSKRYALMAALGLPTEDDDGQAAGKKGKDKPEIVLTDKQVEFSEKLKIKLEKACEGEQFSLDKIQGYMKHLSKTTGNPVHDKDEQLNPLAKYILGKPETVNVLKGKV